MRSVAPQSQELPCAASGPGDTLFRAILEAASARAEVRTRALRLLPLALLLHLLLLGAAQHLSRASSPGAASGSVEPLVLYLGAAPTAGPAPERLRTVPPVAGRPARRPPRRALPVPPPAQQQPQTPAPQQELPPPPPLEDLADVAVANAGVGGSGPAPAGKGGGAVQGSAWGLRGGSAVRAGGYRLSLEQQLQTLEQYLALLYTTRFRNVPYPHQAAAAGISGVVNLRVVVGPRGELLSLQRADRCPRPVLCEGAEEAVRRASPFPPPPPELGSPLAIDLPFRYFFY